MAKRRKPEEPLTLDERAIKAKQTIVHETTVECHFCSQVTSVEGTATDAFPRLLYKQGWRVVNDAYGDYVLACPECVDEGE